VHVEMCEIFKTVAVVIRRLDSLTGAAGVSGGGFECNGDITTATSGGCSNIALAQGSSAVADKKST
jgi:hypothetical protein